MRELKFSTSKGEFLLVDLPLDTKEVQDIYLNGISWKDNRGHWETWYSENEEETIYFISSLKEITEEQASEILEENHKYNFGTIIKPDYGFYDYIKENSLLNNSIESLHSLLKSKGIYLYKNPYTPKINPLDYRKAEEKTFYNPYIFKIK